VDLEIAGKTTTIGFKKRCENLRKRRNPFGRGSFRLKSTRLGIKKRKQRGPFGGGGFETRQGNREKKGWKVGGGLGAASYLGGGLDWELKRAKKGQGGRNNAEFGDCFFLWVHQICGDPGLKGGEGSVSGKDKVQQRQKIGLHGSLL